MINHGSMEVEGEGDEIDARKKDEERERRDSPPGQRGESGPDMQNGTHVGN